MNIQTIMNTATRAIGRGTLTLQKHSPAILLTAGLVGSAVSTILACKATLQLERVIDNAQEKIGAVKNVAATHDKERYSDAEYRKDLAAVYIQSGVELIKLYGPSLSLGFVSYFCIVGGHQILNKRNVALIGAYKVLDKVYSEYRERVVEEYGEKKDYQFAHGIREEQVSVQTVGEDGKKKKTKQTIQVMDPNKHSQYARFFDEGNPNWSKTPEYNLIFLRCQQNYANDMLKSRGHIFLNEVYDSLGIPRSQAGQFVGWALGAGDDFVDFGLYDYESSATRDFVNGYEPTILLDFNVDGVMWELI